MDLLKQGWAITKILKLRSERTLIQNLLFHALIDVTPQQALE